MTFVVTPVAGQQHKLSDLQVGYQHAVWEGIATAAGPTNVTFFDGTGTTPGTGTIPPVPIPDPNAKINSEQQGPTRTCTLPSSSGCPPRNVAQVVGYGDTKPLVEPASDPANRAVVDTFTMAG